MNLDCAGKSLDLSQTVLMGVLNVTPDSFSDGGQFIELDAACQQAQAMLRAGARIIDIGGESTRPGADPVSTDEELARVIPVIERLYNQFDCIISIDTSKPQVMLAAVNAGASIINDVCGLASQQSMQAAAEANVPVCIMHMRGEPRSMQKSPSYDDVVKEVKDFLLDKASQCVDHGILKSNIIIDPGFGFGKKVHHNVSLLNHLDELCAAGYPVLAGLSRKSMIGHLLGLPVDERVAPSVALAIIAVQKGAKIIRTHDVKQTHDAIRMIEALGMNESNISQ